MAAWAPEEPDGRRPRRGQQALWVGTGESATRPRGLWGGARGEDARPRLRRFPCGRRGAAAFSQQRDSRLGALQAGQGQGGGAGAPGGASRKERPIEGSDF